MILTVTIFLFYGFWGVLSLVCQGNHPIVKSIKSHDVFGLIPNFKFFCPNPVRNDYHLYYRKCNALNGWDQWEEICIPKRHRIFSMLWNPGKRERKVFTSAIRKIKTTYKNKPERVKGPVYTFFLKYILQYASAGDTDSVQFKITTRQDLNKKSEESVIFVSAIHFLSPAL